MARYRDRKRVVSICLDPDTNPMTVVHDDISNRQLVEACSRGNSRAIEIFYERYRDLIYCAINNWLRQYAPERCGSEDLHEVFQNAIVVLMENNFARVRQARDPERISGLVYLIAFRVTGRYFGKKWREDRLRGEEEDPVYQPEDEIIDRLTRNERMDLVKEFYGTLRPIEQDVIRHYFEDGRKYREIAEITGLTPTNVGAMISRIKERFRSFIRERYGSDLSV